MLRLDWNLLFTILNLLIFYVVIKKFLIRPVLSMMDKREQMIQDQLEAASAKEAEAEERKAQYEASLAGAKEEAASIVEKARSEAKAHYDQAVQEAEAEAGRIAAKAQRDAANEKEQARRDVQAEVAGLAMAAVAKILQDGSSPESDEALYRQFLQKAGGAHDAEGH